MQRYLLSLLICCLSGLNAQAQPFCSVKTFNLRDGLASNVITGLEQTPDQLMWFATWNGLTSYDGYHFTVFRDNSEAQGRQRVLTTNRLLNIQPNAQGDIWCITYDLNAYLFDRRQGQYVDVTDLISQRLGAPFHTNRAIALKNGHTWLLNVDREGPAVRINDADFASADGIQFFSLAEPQQRRCQVDWVLEDDDRQEWIVTREGLQLLDGSFQSDIPFRFMQQVDNHVYMATTDGRISQYDKATRQLTALSMPPSVTGLYTLLAARQLLVAATDGGLFVYDTQQHSSRLIPLPFAVNGLVRSIFVDSQQRLWMGTGSTDVLMVSLTEGSTQLLSTAGQQLLRQSTATIFHEDRHHTLWAATEQGFFGYFDEQRHAFVAHPLRTAVSQPLIERWSFDQQGNLWFSGEHNLAMASFNHRYITHVGGMQEVRSVAFDHEGRIWAGNLSGDVAIYTADGQQLGYLGPDGRIHPSHVRFSTHIYCLYEDREHRLWIGTKGDGLYCLDTEGQLYHYGDDQLPSNQVYDVHQDLQGRIWVGTFERGICLLDGDLAAGRFLAAPEQFPAYPIADYHKVRRITETADSVIIVSASNGLVTFSERFSDPAQVVFHAHKHVQGDTTSLATSDVMQALVTRHDSVFIATVGGGMQLVRADELLDDHLLFHSVNRLIDDYGTVLTLSQDQDGNLWIGRENSLNMFESATGQLWRFGPNLIGEHTEMTEAKPAFNPQADQLALATTDGFITFHPKRLREDTFVPSIVFTGVQLHGEQELRQMMLGDSLEVNADQRNLTIHFAALDYQDNYMIRYAYMLEGIDHDWNQLGPEHSITFNNLPAGCHRLLVRSTNNYGTWVDNVHTLHLYVHPTFWETGWAKLLYALLGLLVLGVAIWIYRLYVRNSMERKLNDMKTQFFTDVSHKLRTPLTLIGGPVTQVLQAGGLSDMARQHLEMVERNARRMLGLVNKMLIYSKEHHTYISDENLSGEWREERGERSDFANEGKSYSLTSHPSPLTSENTTPQPATRLLIVEDNDDLRQFLVSILQSDYEVLQASNGREGLEKAQAEQPDFILTDVMMPEMDGLTMVHRIKADPDISHIPIVILSAKASMDDRLEGLKAGVNDYITKPFSATYLKQRMQNIIQNQRLLQQTILASIKPNERTVWEEEPAEVADTTSATDEPAPEEGQTLRLKATTIVDTDKQMMEQLLEYIEANLSNADLRIEDLASALCLGRTVFYNKVKTLVGMSPVELLRHIRIQHAEDMVAKSTMPFSQIAYAVGFSDPRYFGKCFKKQTGLTPSEYREQHVS